MTIATNRSNAKLLLVDDEQNNLTLLQDELEDAGYKNFLVACDGYEAIDKINENKNNIDVILLDRMMPDIDGMEVLKIVKQDKQLRTIPVVMQTAAATKEQIIEGIEAGAYHYLTKPYDEQTMVSVVDAAIRDGYEQKALIDKAKKFQDTTHFLRQGEFHVKTLYEAQKLSAWLSANFPDQEMAVMGISELLINAIEHGNLEIGYETKTQLLENGNWESEIEKRLKMEPYCNRVVVVSYKKTNGSIEINIKDEGKGFDWRSYMELDPKRATHSHGRGIAMARMMLFNEYLIYKGAGNEVLAIFRYQAKNNESESGHKQE